MGFQKAIMTILLIISQDGPSVVEGRVALWLA